MTVRVKTGEAFKGCTVVVFGLPGAFTPTCSSAHVPRYVELKDAFKAAGVDEIVAHCARAKQALADKGLPYGELPTTPRILRALPGARTTPQVFVDGKHIGGADELIAWLGSR